MWINKIEINICFMSLFLFVFLFSCTREEITEQVVNTTYVQAPEYLYEVETLSLQQSGIDKPNQKTLNEFASIAYSDLFDETIAQDKLSDLLSTYAAFGDKILVEELIIRNFLNQSGLVIPSETEMNNNVDLFIEETYKKLFNRNPNEFEAWKLKDLIENNDIGPEVVYFSFMTSEEYRYY